MAEDAITGDQLAMSIVVDFLDMHDGVPLCRGEAIASASLPAWPNTSFHDSVYRWEDAEGRVTHATYQEIWFDTYQRAMVARAAAPSTV